MHKQTNEAFVSPIGWMISGVLWKSVDTAQNDEIVSNKTTQVINWVTWFDHKQLS